MLIGFVLLVSACGHDACDALPVSERIYPTKVACEQMADRIHKVRRMWSCCAGKCTVNSVPVLFELYKNKPGGIARSAHSVQNISCFTLLPL